MTTPACTAAGQRLLDKWEAEAILITRGEHGMTLFTRDAAARHFPTAARQVFDVTGAGDTVVAACALALAAGATLEEAAWLANHAAGVVVGKLGTATVSAPELRTRNDERKDEGESKIGMKGLANVCRLIVSSRRHSSFIIHHSSFIV